MKLGNTKLVDYGIQNEVSDIRAHVSPITKRVYVFKTRVAAEVATSNGYRRAPAYTGNIKTAEGYLVPPDDIPGCKQITIPDDIFSSVGFSPRFDNQTIKGQKAVSAVTQMLKRGLLPIELEIEHVTDEAIQIQGTDIIVSTKTKIQVKYDERAGPKELGGSGNLFLQVAECNPLGMH